MRTITLCAVLNLMVVASPTTPAYGKPTSAPVCETTPTTQAMTATLGRLHLPVRGVTSQQLRDTFTERRGSNRVHEALDIPAPQGTPVLAASAGRIAKLFWSERGGTTLYQTDTTGTFVLYYAHLLGYAEGVHEGQRVRPGDMLGYVGATGNARPDVPHLHFAVWHVCDARHFWQGTPINPYPLLQPGP